MEVSDDGSQTAATPTKAEPPAGRSAAQSQEYYQYLYQYMRQASGAQMGAPGSRMVPRSILKNSSIHLQICYFTNNVKASRS